MPRFLQIFRKDVRRLTPFLLAVFALQAVFAIGTIHSVGFVDTGERLENILGFIEAILFLCWGLLIALAILEDPLVGDNAFWLTRPYSWRSLFAAKVLFVLTFLNLPLLISDVVILKTLSLSFDIPHLLVRQLPLIALTIIPFFAFATISSRLSQFWLLLVIALVVMAVESFSTAHWFRYTVPFLKVPDTIALLAISLCAIPAIVIHYARRPDFTRIWLFALFALSIPPVFLTTHLVQNEAFFIRRHPATSQGNQWQQIHLVLSNGGLHRQETPNFKDTIWFGVHIPIRVEGLPPGVILGGEGETFLGKEPKPFPTVLKHDKRGYYLDISGFFRRVVHNVNISVRTSLQVWVLNDRPTYKTILHPFDLLNIPNVGLCQFLPNGNDLTCWRGPLRPPNLPIAGKTWTSLASTSYALDEGEVLYDELIWDLSPIEKHPLGVEASNKLAAGDELSFAPQFLIGSFHRDLRADQFPIFDARPDPIYGTFDNLPPPIR